METRDLLAALTRGKIAVIGDVMVDHYVVGDVSRISPEAPAPVLQVTSERHVLGGAANVAANVAALGGRVRLVGAIGDDPIGRLLVQMLDGKGSIEANLQVAQGHPTITKTRYVCGQQQIVQVDREELSAFPERLVAALIAEAEEAVEASDVVVLSDYGKGVLCNGVLAACLASAKASGKPTIVDPKRKRFDAYKGAGFITPNRREMTNATDLPCETDDEAAAAAAVAFRQCRAAILLTRSERGMSVFRAGHDPLHLAANAREVFDVSGAGDTVVAAFSLALAGGLQIEQAMQVANEAAGVVVGKLGTAICTRDELAEAISRRAHDRSGDDSDTLGISLAEALHLRAKWRDAGLKVGFTNGCFDLIHPGHVSLLRQAAQTCDRLIVALNSDASVRRLKGPQRPIQNERARSTVIEAIKGVDCVIVFDEETPLKVISALSPDVLVKGGDYAEEQVVGADLVKDLGGRVVLAELAPGYSTTRLVSRFQGTPLPNASY